MTPRALLHILGAFVLSFPIPALSQVTTVPVRGGEHADYTRLAITLPPDVTWQVTQNRQRVTLAVAGPPLRFDTTQTFARIPRTRLQSVQAAQNELVLQLNCVCAIRASEDLPSMLVLDVLNPSPTTATLAGDTMRPRPRPERPLATDMATRVGVDLARALRAPTAEQGVAPPALLPASPVLAAPNDSARATPPAPPDAVDIEDPRAQTLSELGNALAVAVGHGLLAPTESAIVAPNRAENPTDPRPAMPLQRQLVVSDSVARALAQSAPVNGGGQVCPDPKNLSIQNWTPEQSQTGAKADIAHLFDEMDQINATVLRQIVREQLYFGFGKEAQVTLSLLPTQSADDAVLGAIATLLDLPPDTAVSLPAAIHDCGDMGALWAMLAKLPAPIDPDFPISAAIRGVATLPIHLRLYLGPYLLRHLTAQEYLTHAHTLRDILSRVASQETNPAMTFAFNALADLDGPTENTPLAQTATIGAAPEDVLFLLRQQGKTGAPLQETLITAANAHIFALRGTELAAQIGVELGIGLARDSDFDGAFAIAKSPDLALPPATAHEFRGRLLDMLVASATDADFLTYVFEAEPWVFPVTPAVMGRLADRLRLLGFDDKASQTLRHMQAIGAGSGDASGAPAQNVAPTPSAIESADAGIFAVAATPNSSNLAPTAATLPMRPDAEPQTQIAQAPDLLSDPTLPKPPDQTQGLLTAGRDALAQSATLRARLSDMLTTP